MPHGIAGDPSVGAACSNVIHRDLTRTYKTIVRAAGCELWDEEGIRYLDAVGGAGVVTIGHGVAEITRGLADHAAQTSYVYGDAFSNPWQESLATTVLDLLGISGGVYFVSGGSEANETAIKLARQYHVERGRGEKYKVISRWLSYHGVTLATLAISGRTSWRTIYSPYLMQVGRVVPPYCYRCPLKLSYPTCELACADDLERAILLEGPETVSAFIAEPIIGTTVTGVTPVPEYYAKVRQICDKYDVLFIADEVLTGFGRTGRPFALQHWDVQADIYTMGKGIGSGYVALGAVAAADHVLDAIRNGTGTFVHGFTYSGMPSACFIGTQVAEYLHRHDLFERARELGDYLHEQLHGLARRHESIGDVRGMGMLAGVELVSDSDSRTPFPASERIAQRIASEMERRGVLVRPGVPGSNYGAGGDHIQISPPYVISEAQIDYIVETLDAAVSVVTGS
jgi:adenosylmethionine-8-amino-7-oxononanoate aminotransferase